MQNPPEFVRDNFAAAKKLLTTPKKSVTLHYIVFLLYSTPKTLYVKY